MVLEIFIYNRKIKHLEDFPFSGIIWDFSFTFHLRTQFCVCYSQCMKHAGIHWNGPWTLLMYPSMLHASGLAKRGDRWLWCGDRQIRCGDSQIWCGDRHIELRDRCCAKHEITLRVITLSLQNISKVKYVTFFLHFDMIFLLFRWRFLYL